MNFGNINLGSPVNWDSPLNQGLVSWWLPLPNNQGGGTLFDLCGRNHGTLTSIDWVPGQSGFTALSFAGGTSKYVDCGATQTIITDTSNWTVGLWYFARTNTTFPILAGFRSGAGTLYGIACNSAVRSPLVAGSGTTPTFNGTLNVWQHILVSSVAGTRVTYLNGFVAAAGGTSAGAYGIVMNNIGRGFSSAAPDGLIYDVRVWGRGLSAPEVFGVYADSLTGYRETLRRKVRLARTSAPAAPAGGHPASRRFGRKPIGVQGVRIY